MKFCAKRKSATETFPMLNTTYRDVAMKLHVLRVSRGMDVSRLADSRLTTMSALGVLQRQLTTNMLTKSTPWCAQIDV